MNNLESIRLQVPAIGQEVYGKPLIYFDSAATAHKPESVISLINKMNSGINANIHRAIHKLSVDTTRLYEQARDNVKTYINAEKREEIIFTSGTTAAINLVANSFADKYLSEGDSVLITESEHHSNIVPWQMVCERKKANLKVIPVDEDGNWMNFESYLDETVKIVSVTHISNILGVVNPIVEIIEKAHSVGAKVLIDGAQGIVHEKVDVKKLDCDFYVFSGHKIYASTGIGILYGKENILEELPPWMGGGDMVETVSFAKTTYAELPLKFEAGTPNFIGAASLTPALDFARQLETLKENEKAVVSYLNKKLREVEGLRIYGNSDHKIPLFSFTVEGVHHSDIAALLDKVGIAVRSGMMCAEPLITKYNQTGMVRASLSPYNTIEECEYFVDSLNRIINMLR